MVLDFSLVCQLFFFLLEEQPALDLLSWANTEWEERANERGREKKGEREGVETEGRERGGRERERERERGRERERREREEGGVGGLLLLRSISRA